MTPRQKEFCRHYLKGLSAPRAARAAGYSDCTAEKNAAAILSSESVARFLDRHRKEAIIITADHLTTGRDRMLKIIAEGDDKAAAIAFHNLLRLKRLEPILAAELSNTSTPQTSTENPTQLPDNQPEEPSAEIEETDTLPTGEPSFGHRLAPLKPEVALPLPPVTINFSPLNPLNTQKPPQLSTKAAL